MNSKTTYALVAWKQAFEESTPDEDIILAAKQLTKEIDAVLQRHGAEYSTIEEVMEKRASTADARIGSSNITDLLNDEELEP